MVRGVVLRWVGKGNVGDGGMSEEWVGEDEEVVGCMREREGLVKDGGVRVVVGVVDVVVEEELESV